MVPGIRPRDNTHERATLTAATSRAEVHMPRPPNLPRPLLGELTDNQKALVVTLGTACFAVLGFVVQSKLDERWGGLQEVCARQPELSVCFCAPCADSYVPHCRSESSTIVR